MFRAMRGLMSVCCVAVCFTVAGVSPLFAQEDATKPRTWSDVSGKFKVTATFVSLENDELTLKQEDGEEIVIPLDKLSLVDRGFARRFATAASDNPFKPKGAGDSPFKPKMSKDDDAAPSDADTAEEEPAVESRTVEVDWNTATAVDPQPTNDEWAGAITPEQLAEGAPTLKSKTIRLPARRDFFEKQRAVVFSPSGEKAVIGYTWEKRNGREKETSTRLVLVDTTTGKSLGSDVIDGEFVPRGLEDSGRRLLVQKAQWGFGNSDELEVWSLSSSGIQRGLKWAPHGDQQHADRDINWGKTIAENRALTVGRNGRLVLWDLESGEPAWYHDIKGGQPGISPNGKYVAYQADKAIGLLDVDAGTVVALLSTDELHLNALAFSPDGKSLAATNSETLFVWDVATGTLSSEVSIRNLGGAQGDLAWTDPEYVLLGNQWLVHVPSRITVWQYTGGSSTQCVGGICWFYLSPHGGGEGLVGSSLPHAAAKDALETAMANPDFFLLKPGATVSLDVSGIPQPDQATVTSMLTSGVNEAGFKIAAGSPVTFKATMNRGKTREIEYRTFGSFGTTKHSVQEYNLKFAITTGGKSAWETSTVHVAAPFHVSLKEGETIAEVLKKADKPGYEWFDRIRMPKFVPQPSERPSLGTTAVSVQGVR